MAIPLERSDVRAESFGADTGIAMSPVGYVRSCFKEKFAIPRQPRLAPAAHGVLEFVPPFDTAEAMRGLEQSSHIWLLFHFHRALQNTVRTTVRPPRLGGNRAVGVFATRSTHRPNSIGQSVVTLEDVQPGKLHLSGIDLLDGTPVLDVKPYLPYADSVENATNTMAGGAPHLLAVEWSDTALAEARHHATRLQEPLVDLIRQCLAQDPRPAYQKPVPERTYGTVLWDLDVRWSYPRPDAIRVTHVGVHPG